MSKVNELEDKFPGAPKELYYLKAGLEDVIMPAINEGKYFMALMEARNHLMRLETKEREILLKTSGGNLISSVRIMIEVLSRMSGEDENDEENEDEEEGQSNYQPGNKDKDEGMIDIDKGYLEKSLERVRAFLAQTLMPYRKVPETT